MDQGPEPSLTKREELIPHISRDFTVLQYFSMQENTF